jgi:two-component system chemotaxis sensor kinase CheA
VLSFPLTVTTVRVILFTLAGRTFGFNVTSVERVVRVDPAAIAVVEGRSVMLYGENRIPFVPLHAVLGIEPPADGATPPIAVVVKRRGHSVAMGVDALLDEREVHLRPLGPRLGALPKVSGAAIAGDGSVALILRGAAVIESALATARTLRSAPAAPAQTVAAKRVLLVDDSITTRTLERSILEAAGYEVLTAADGHDAWTLLGEQSVDVVVSDVDMPRMNGFALVEAVRTSSSLRELPIILVTARESEIDRQRGLESGADAYIVKSSFRQEELLEAIGALT